jgi:hypothetical protein
MRQETTAAPEGAARFEQQPQKTCDRTCVQHIPAMSQAQRDYLPHLVKLKAGAFNKFREGKSLEIMEDGETYTVVVVDNLYRVRSTAGWCANGEIAFNDILLQSVVSRVRDLIAQHCQSDFGGMFMESTKSLKGVAPISREAKTRRQKQPAQSASCLLSRSCKEPSK